MKRSTRTAKRKASNVVEADCLKPSKSRNQAKDPVVPTTETEVLKKSDKDTNELVKTGKENIALEANDIFSQILKRKDTVKYAAEKVLSSYHNVGRYSSNVVNYIDQRQFGIRCGQRLKQSVYSPITELISSLNLVRTASPFDRRCTALEWHPTNPNLMVVGSKGGDLILWDINKIDNEKFLPGIGPGGSIQALKFLPGKSRFVLTASIDGTVTQHDLESEGRQILADTMNSHDFWYCSLDVNSKRNMLVTGENSGKLLMMNTEGNKLWEKKLHKAKITHTEFSPREDWLLCTASLDKTCKLWDVRMISDKNSALYTLTHDKPINSAYFSLTDGCRLLLTDQQQSLYVYSAPLFHRTLTILHPHRKFQHLTPLKAFWHPLQDVIVIARYPDKKFKSYTPDEKRTIDVFNAETGKMECQLYDPAAPGICSLTKFNHMGDTLAATMGVNILIWKPKEEAEEIKEELLQKMIDSGLDKVKPKPKPRKPRSNQTKEKKDKKTTETKLKLLTQTQSKNRKK